MQKSQFTFKFWKAGVIVSDFNVALPLPVWPHTTRFKVTVASVGRPCFAPLHPLWVQCGKAWEAPGMLCEKPHNGASTEQSGASLTHRFCSLNKWVFLILPARWNQIIITGLITDTAVTLPCMISQNTDPTLLFIFSSTHQLVWMKPTGTQTTPAGSSIPQKGKSRGLWLLYMALGTYNLWSVSGRVVAAWCKTYYSLLWREAFTVFL